SDIGEFGLIERIRTAQRGANRSVILGIGDDAAAFALSRGTVGLVTTDTLADRTHFDLRYTTYRDLGWKAMAANLSDIAAMGGRPLLAVVALTLTDRQSVRDVDELYRGMRALGQRHGVTIAGGDVVRGKELSLTIAVIGECRRGNLGLRSGARPGDAVLVTGTLGASRAGLELLRNAQWKMKNGKSVRKHLRPEPRVREGLVLAKRFKLHGMIDISDGLAPELHHLAAGSRAGIVIDQGALPVADEAVAASRRTGKDPADYCLHGGEEYELLFTLPLADAVKARSLLEGSGTRCTIIGQVVRGRGVRTIGRDGRRRALPAEGYAHFRPGAAA
ncbi:MAG: thiamine-phosphate kinase, partial [Candidatus Edwardsbacteria bacterium]|nr:thiamine-phosphate kinase [Candidatus Edwardsbacteria bacterium]